MMKPSQFILRAVEGKKGHDYYLSTDKGSFYIATRRPNTLMWQRFKDGISLGELKRSRPSGYRSEQFFYERTRYILRVVDDFIKQELAA